MTGLIYRSIFNPLLSDCIEESSKSYLNHTPGQSIYAAVNITIFWACYPSLRIAITIDLFYYLLLKVVPNKRHFKFGGDRVLHFEYILSFMDVIFRPAY